MIISTLSDININSMTKLAHCYCDGCWLRWNFQRFIFYNVIMTTAAHLWPLHRFLTHESDTSSGSSPSFHQSETKSSTLLSHPDGQSKKIYAKAGHKDGPISVERWETHSCPHSCVMMRRSLSRESGDIFGDGIARIELKRWENENFCASLRFSLSFPFADLLCDPLYLYLATTAEETEGMNIDRKEKIRMWLLCAMLHVAIFMTKCILSNS